MANNRILKQSQTYYGSTQSNLWTWKQQVDEYVEIGGDNDYILTNKSIVVVTSFLGRANSQSFFGGHANYEIICNGESRKINKYYNPTIPAGGWFAVQTEEFVIDHTSDGSKTISVSSSMNTQSFTPKWAKCDTVSVELFTIPRANTIAVGNYNLGQTIGIIIGKKVDSFTSTISYKIGTRTGVIASKTQSDSLTWTMPNELINQIKADNPANKDVSCEMHCDTYNGSSVIGTTQIAPFTLYIIDKPVITKAFREEMNKNIDKLTDDVLKGVSKNRFYVTATAPYGTTIAKYTIRNGSQNSESTDGTLDLNNIQSPTPGYENATTFTINCYDARGNKSADFELDYYFLNYVQVLIRDTDVKITRPNGTSNEAYVHLSGSYYNGNIGAIKNTVTIDCDFRVKGTSSYTRISNLTLTPTSDNTFLIDNLKIPYEFDYTETYEFVFYAKDSINETDDASFILASSVPIAKWHKNGAYIKNIDTDLIKINGNDIIESGNNSNGEWIKFMNGTMIQCGRSSAYKVITISFPKAFSSIPYVISQIVRPDLTDSTAELISMVGDVTESNFKLRGRYFYGGRWDMAGEPIDWMAIGKWK